MMIGHDVWELISDSMIHCGDVMGISRHFLGLFLLA